MSLKLVLVRPKYSRNIGAAARAVGNMGGHLIVISPQCEIDYEAQQSAAGSQDSLKQCSIYSCWEDFVSSEAGLCIAFTRRTGRNRPTTPLKEKLLSLQEHQPETLQQSICLILGPEDHGLSDKDLFFSHHLCHLPTYGDFSSLNLAQASLLALFITKDFLSQNKISPNSSLKEEDYISSHLPHETIESWIKATGFSLEKSRMNACNILKKFLLRNTPSKKELSVLQAILEQNIRKLKNNN